MDIASSQAMNRVKADLIRRHEAWLEQHGSQQLYRRHQQARRIELLLDMTRDLRGNVLDIGCFDGFVAEAILRQGGKTVYGMDRLKSALDRAQERGIIPILGDIDTGQIAFPDGYFDCVVMGEVLDYVFDPDAVIAEIRRIVAPGGKLIITVPNLVSLSNRLRVLGGRPPYSLDVRPQEGGYWRYFTFATLTKLVADYGFRIDSLQANVVALPFFLLPGLHNRFGGERWEEYRIFSSERVARWFPQLGENIVLLATKEIVQD